MLRIEIDGGEPTTDQLAVGLLANYGHFTAMQVRDRRVQGLDLHLRRLDAQHRELYGEGLPGDRVRALIARALGEVRDAAVRVIAFGPEAPKLMVVVRPPAGPSDRPQRLISVDYQRHLPHVKHIGGFGQLLHGNRAKAAGYDDALLTTPDGVVIEGAIANIAFFDHDGGIVWPEADWLHGIAMQLLERELPSRRAVVRRADLPLYRGAFLSNSIGVTAVSGIDDLAYPVDETAIDRVRGALAAVPWDALDE
ncbi:aminotransferase class IV [Saccharothrix variisporea]|uniref:Branched-subunit amino acid aminotransferase/4-amino-4-deoxychorismate lyase n=1 Tax=Saccharothrix variisporea TaxID=543527 RepID=A0A495X234_9PSEU|nr:aminotransferase class IV [Saccharothrix variisporea]RKT68251.1 branched-subunit amino acid aminotransferase/4-amino-4-deoxychorismate lyase [Saccharothrix variisporea]